MVLPGQIDFSRLPQQVFVQMAALVVLLVWLLEGGSVSSRTGRRGFDAPLLAVLAVSALSLVGSPDPGSGLPTLVHWSCCGLVYLVVSRASWGATEGRRLLLGLFVGGALVAVVGLAQALGGLQAVPQAAAPASTLANRNVAASYLVAVLPLGWLAWSSGRRRTRWATLGALVAIVAFLPTTLSRLAALALAGQLVLLVAIAARRGALGSRGRRAWAGVGLAAALVLVAAIVWLSAHDPAKARSLRVRTALAGSAVEMLRESPWVGVGLGRFGAEYPRVGPAIRPLPGAAPLVVSSPHSEPLQVLAETGPFGGVALAWVALAVLAALARLWRSRSSDVRRLALVIGLSLLGLAVDAVGGFPLRTAVAPLVLATLLGVLAALEARERVASPVPARGPSATRRSSWRWAPVAGVVVLLVVSATWSARRVSADRVLYLQALEDEETEAGCPPDLQIAALEEQRVALEVDSAPLADILQCLSERTGFRLEFDGPAPAERVSMTLEAEPLVTAFEKLFEGLGVDYLLGFDPSGTRVQRLIVVNSSGSGARRSPSSASAPSPAGLPPLELTASPEGTASSDEPPEATTSPSAGGEWGEDPGEQGEDPGYGLEDSPEFAEPGELSPMTLRPTSGGAYAVRSRTITGSGV